MIVARVWAKHGLKRHRIDCYLANGPRLLPALLSILVREADKRPTETE
jgi:hypothetical protein